MGARITVDQKRIDEFCRKNFIRRLAFFGSVLRDDFGPDSDIDVLVEFDLNHVPGLAFFEMQSELSALLGRNVDLNTPSFLNHYFRPIILKEALTQYEVA